MPTHLYGEVYASAPRRGEVSIRVGLHPKVIRFPTTESWREGDEVIVVVFPRHPDVVKGYRKQEDMVTWRPKIDVDEMPAFDLPPLQEEGSVDNLAS